MKCKYREKQVRFVARGPGCGSVFGRVFGGEGEGRGGRWLISVRGLCAPAMAVYFSMKSG